MPMYPGGFPRRDDVFATTPAWSLHLSLAPFQISLLEAAKPEPQHSLGLMKTVLPHNVRQATQANPRWLLSTRATKAVPATELHRTLHIHPANVNYLALPLTDTVNRITEVRWQTQQISLPLF